MNEVTLRTRIAALVVAALLAMSGAAVTTAVFADEASAVDGGFGNDFINVSDTIFGDSGDDE